MERKELNKKELVQEVNNAFNKIIGEVLEIAEGFYKKDMGVDKWNSFRKLVLDFGNAHRRYVEAKIEGRNYYHLVPLDRKGN